MNDVEQDGFEIRAIAFTEERDDPVGMGCGVIMVIILLSGMACCILSVA